MEDYSHKKSEYLALESTAIIKNHTEDLEKAFKMLQILYKRTDSPQAEQAKHYVASALGELKKAHEWAEAIETKEAEVEA
jgi:hypothetical protein